ncbi:MAG: hypothetical protein MZV70_20235 [Desulfobacterales bacterium]|nr:hypothetical protein [Desulfobacterales bacterium]
MRPGINVLERQPRGRAASGCWRTPGSPRREIQREIPSTLRIRIREHVPAAVVDVGRRVPAQRPGRDLQGVGAVGRRRPAGGDRVLVLADLRGRWIGPAQRGCWPLSDLARGPAPAPARSRPIDAVHAGAHPGPRARRQFCPRRRSALHPGGPRTGAHRWWRLTRRPRRSGWATTTTPPNTICSRDLLAFFRSPAGRRPISSGSI